MKFHANTKPAACSHCRQDIIRDCQVCMYPGQNGACLYEPIKKIAIAGAHVGLDIDAIIEMMNSGMSIIDLVTYIDSCRAAN